MSLQAQWLIDASPASPCHFTHPRCVLLSAFAHIHHHPCAHRHICYLEHRPPPSAIITSFRVKSLILLYLICAHHRDLRSSHPFQCSDMFKDHFHSQSCPDQVERTQNSSPGCHPDNFKMSYYGETSMYLVSITGNFGCHAARDPSTTLLGVPIAKSLEQCTVVSWPLFPSHSHIKSSCQTCPIKRWPLICVSTFFMTLVQCHTIPSRSTPRVVFSSSPGSVTSLKRSMFLADTCLTRYAASMHQTHFTALSLLMDVSF